MHSQLLYGEMLPCRIAAAARYLQQQQHRAGHEVGSGASPGAREVKVHSLLSGLLFSRLRQGGFNTVLGNAAVKKSVVQTGKEQYRELPAICSPSIKTQPSHSTCCSQVSLSPLDPAGYPL